MSTHINHLKSLTSQLNGIEPNLVKDDIVIAVLLKSLPYEDYGAITTTLKLLPEPTLPSIEAALLEEEKKLKKVAVEHEESFSSPAYFMKGGYANNGSRERYNKGGASTTKGATHFKGKGKKTCNFCGRPGHIESECFVKKNLSANLVSAIEEEEEEDREEEGPSEEANAIWAF